MQSGNKGVGTSKRGANDSTFMDSTLVSDLDQSMAVASRAGVPVDRNRGFEEFYTPRQSDAGSQPLPPKDAHVQSTPAPIDFDAWAGEDSGLDLQVSDLEALEKNRFEPRRTTLVGKQFGETFKSIQRQSIAPKVREAKQSQQPKINAKEIANIVQARFFGEKQPEVIANERKISEATEGQESDDRDSVGPGIQMFIEKFGFVEMNEVDQILQAVVPQPDTQDLKQKNLLPSLQQKKQFIEDVKDIPLLEQEILNGVNSLLDGAGLKGTICSFAVSPKSHSLFMFGTETGEILECAIGDKPSVKKHSLDSKVTSLAVSPNDEFFAAGSANSELLIKKTEGKLAKKYLKSLNQQRIQQIQFLENNTLLVATYNCVYHFMINSMVGVLLELNHIDVHKHPTDIVMQTTAVFHEGLWKGLVVLHDKVVAFGIHKEDKKNFKASKIGTDIENAEFVDAPQNNKWPPVVDWVLPEPGSDKPLRFVLMWRNYLRTYTLESQKWSLADQGITLNKIAWITVLDNRILCLANTQLEFEFLTIQRIENSTFIDNGDHAKAKIDAGLLKDQRDQNYMTKYKDKLEELEVDISMKLPFFNFFKNRIKDTSKGIYMITDKGLVRCYFAGLEKLVEAYKVRGHTKQAFDLANSVLSGKINSKPDERYALVMEAPLIVKSYIEKYLREDMVTNDQIELLNSAFEVLIAANKVDYAFSDIQPKFNKRLFWEHVSVMIKEKRMPQVTYHYLNDGLPYLENDEVAELCKDFFTIHQNTEVDEREIITVLNIMKKKNIWPFLYKFCMYFPSQAIPVFLSSLASEILLMNREVRDQILEEAIWQRGKETDLNTYFEEDNRRLFFRVFWFFNLVLSPHALEQSLSHFGDPEYLSPNIAEIHTKTLEWILDHGNSKLVVDTHRQMYFELIYSCLSNEALLKSGKVTQLVNNLRKIYLKKRLENLDPTSTKFIAVFRPFQSLETTPYPFCVAEITTLILESILDQKYHQELGFMSIKLLNNTLYSNRYEHIEWVYCNLLMCLNDVYEPNKFWMRYQPVNQDSFEDLVIATLGQLGSFIGDIGTSKDKKEGKESESRKERRRVLTEAAYNSKFTRTYLALVGHDLRLSELFKLYLRNTTETNSFYLFQWLRKCCSDSSINKQELVEEIIRNINQLVSWNKEELRDIVERLPTIGQKFVDALEPFPDLQLKYLERLMQRNRNHAEQLEDHHKLKYLELMCKSKPDMVVQAIKSYVIPYEESLKICEKYRNLLGMAYIMSKIRNIGEALKIYMEILDEMIEKYLQTSDQAKLEEAKFSYIMIIEICKKESDEMLEEGIKYFDKFLAFLFKIYAQISHKEEEINKRELPQKQDPDSQDVHRQESREQKPITALRKYVKEEFFDDFLVVYVARAGTKGLVELLKHNLQDQKPKDFYEIMRSLKHEKDMIHHIKSSPQF